MHRGPQGERGRGRVGVRAQRLVLHGPLDELAQRAERGAGRGARLRGRGQQRLAGEHHPEHVRVAQRAAPVGQAEPDDVVQAVLAGLHRGQLPAQGPEGVVEQGGEQPGLAAEQRVDRGGRGAAVAGQRAQAEPGRPVGGQHACGPARAGGPAAPRRGPWGGPSAEVTRRRCRAAASARSSAADLGAQGVQPGLRGGLRGGRAPPASGTATTTSR